MSLARNRLEEHPRARREQDTQTHQALSTILFEPESIMGYEVYLPLPMDF